MAGGLFVYIVIAPSIHAIVVSMFIVSTLIPAASTGIGSSTEGDMTGSVALIKGLSTVCASLDSALSRFVISPTKPSNRSISCPFRRPLPNPGPPRCFNVSPISVRIFCFICSGLVDAKIGSFICSVGTVGCCC